MNKPKLLHIALGKHNKGLWRSFEKYFETIHYDWTEKKDDPHSINSDVLELHKSFKPKVIFMQLQKDNVISPQTAHKLSKTSFTVNWTGDVRTPVPTWFVALGKEIDMTLFSNVFDVRVLRELGIPSDYLQVGFDPDEFHPFRTKKSYGRIIFTGSNYAIKNNFPLSNYRIDMVKCLTLTYGSDFRVYGTNWKKITGYDDVFLDRVQEATAYSNSDISINLSHFDYERYSSDRMLRLMGSGGFCLTHDFKGIEKDFIINEHIVTWSNLDDLKNKIDYYWRNQYERELIRANGCKFVRENCTWDKRMLELKTIIGLK